MNPRTSIIACLSAAALLAGCDDRSNNGTTATPAARPPSDTTKAPDNTANNKRDRDMTTGSPKTPMDQSNAKSDIDITAKIRSAIMADKSMSTNAQNCKIITEKGAVTLRGVVNSADEKASVESIVKATVGVASVDNQLEIKAP